MKGFRIRESYHINEAPTLVNRPDKNTVNECHTSCSFSVSTPAGGHTSLGLRKFKKKYHNSVEKIPYIEIKITHDNMTTLKWYLSRQLMKPISETTRTSIYYLS